MKRGRTLATIQGGNNNHNNYDNGGNDNDNGDNISNAIYIQGGNPVLAIAAIQQQVVLEERMLRLEDSMNAKDVLIEEQSQVITQLMELLWLPGRKFNSCVSIGDYNNNSRNNNSTIRSSWRHAALREDSQWQDHHPGCRGLGHHRQSENQDPGEGGHPSQKHAHHLRRQAVGEQPLAVRLQHPEGVHTSPIASPSRRLCTHGSTKFME